VDTTAGVHLQIMLKNDASPLRLYILAHVMLGLIRTAFDDAFVRIRKTPCVL
jgi:hypothetical protein